MRIVFTFGSEYNVVYRSRTYNVEFPRFLATIGTTAAELYTKHIASLSPCRINVVNVNIELLCIAIAIALAIYLLHVYYIYYTFVL